MESVVMATHFRYCKRCFHADYDGEDSVFGEQARSHGLEYDLTGLVSSGLHLFGIYPVSHYIASVFFHMM